MARNKMEDLRNHLFASLERLNDEDITPEELEKELQRAKAVASVSSTIIDSARVEIDLIKAIGGVATDSQFFKEIINPKNLLQ